MFEMCSVWCSHQDRSFQSVLIGYCYATFQLAEKMKCRKLDNIPALTVPRQKFLKMKN